VTAVFCLAAGRAAAAALGERFDASVLFMVVT
jgi:hypothetical protein